MKSWAEVSAAKRGVAEMLSRAAMKLQGPGAEPVDLWEALADARIATLTLTGVANVAEGMRAAELRVPDVKRLIAEGSVRDEYSGQECPRSQEVAV